MHFGNPDFVLEGDPNPAKENILFCKEDKKYVYLEVLTMGDENTPKEHIPIVRMCKPCMALMGEYFWSEYLPKEFWEGYEQNVLHTLKRLVDDPSVESDADLSDILPRLMRGGGFLLKNPNGFSIDRLSPHALWFARCFTSRAARRFFWLRPGCSGRRSRPGRA